MSSDQPSNPKGATQSGERETIASKALDAAGLAQLLQQLAAAGGVPIVLSGAPVQRVDTTAELNKKPRITVAFPSCADMLLSLIRTNGVPQEQKDDITLYFDEYFRFAPHGTVEDPERLRGELDPALLECVTRSKGDWPPGCCVCTPCVRLEGNRNPGPTTPAVIRRLFLGDVLFLFHWEWVFQVLGVILSDYATHGRLPISNGSLDPGIRDDITALVLEVMTRETKTGNSSTVRDRDSTYRRTLGWTSELGRKLGVDAQANTGLSTQWHAFIHHSLQFFDARRMAVAIRGSAAPAPPPSVATLTTIGDIVRSLKKLFEVFDYGRNFQNTLNGLVWLIAAMSVVREIRTTLGIPPAFDRPHEYMDAAYAILIQKRGVTTGEVNRYSLSRDLARHGRDVLLDIEVLNDQAIGFSDVGGELERWLAQREAKIEGYRTAYRALTGVDLGTAIPSSIQQQI